MNRALLLLTLCQGFFLTNNVTFIAGEMRNPRRNLPMSLFLGVGLVITLYVLPTLPTWPRCRRTGGGCSATTWWWTWPTRSLASAAWGCARSSRCCRAPIRSCATGASAPRRRQDL